MKKFSDILNEAQESETINEVAGLVELFSRSMDSFYNEYKDWFTETSWVRNKKDLTMHEDPSITLRNCKITILQQFENLMDLIDKKVYKFTDNLR